MAGFMSNFFPGNKDKAPLDASSPRPTTPARPNSFLNPTSTPQGSPSKRTAPPGAFDLPTAFDNAVSLGSTAVEAPLRLTRPQTAVTPLSPGKANAQPFADEASPHVDDSVIHKGSTPSGSPLKKQGQENTPPMSRLAATDSPHQHNHAALSRQQLYEPREHREPRDRPTTPAAKRFNTSRGLTPEEREILEKPSVKRLTNVTQLCKH